jgi:glycosyltransferase involved in cell wall biosynthesis
MKIAIVLNTSWNIYNFRMNFVKELLKQGHEVHTVAPQDDFTHFLTQAGCKHHRLRMDSRGANPVKDVALIFELWNTYRKIKPDVVLHYTIKPNVYGTLAAAMLKIPVINNVCGLGTVFLKDDLTSSIATALYKFSFRFAKKVFFQNPDDLKLFLDKKLVAKEHVDLLPGSGIDLAKFSPMAYKRNESFTFLMISRLIIDKGVLEYIEAIRKLKEQGINARFQILGSKDPDHKRGIKLKVIDEWARTGAVEYLGSTSDVRSFIEAADCIVLPSYREGTPRTLLEAASSSKPVIATDVAGCHEAVDHNINGLLCKLKDPDDLAKKMLTMASFDEATLRTFGENGRKKMEAQFNETIVIEKYLRTMSAVATA